MPRGENGFGFDEIFELDNGKTLMENEKHPLDDLKNDEIREKRGK